MSVPRWVWVIAGLALLAGAFLWTGARYRSGVRSRFVQYLRAHHPEVEVLEVHRDHLIVRTPSMSGRVNLATLYEQVAEARDASGEEEAFRDYAAALLEHDEIGTQALSLKRHGDHLLPHLARPEILNEVPAGHSLCHREVEPLGLILTYVVQGEYSFRYVTDADLKKLGITADQLHERAMANLRKRSLRDIVRRVVEERAMVNVAVGGGTDATRILLLPEYLRPGEEVAAMIPDRDTLIVMPAPPADKWGMMAGATPPDSDKLLTDRCIRVTCDGLEQK
jgi:hypothetical protein